jgi:hypothetical protein
MRSFRSNVLQSSAQNIMNVKTQGGNLRNSMPTSPKAGMDRGGDGLNPEINGDQFDLTDEAWNQIVKYNSYLFELDKEKVKQKKEDEKKILKEELAK